jgi:hypothetical protein
MAAVLMMPQRIWSLILSSLSSSGDRILSTLD